VFGAVSYLLHTPNVPSAPRETEINQIRRFSIDRYTMNIVGYSKPIKYFLKLSFA
jgi:hypothetical protein